MSDKPTKDEFIDAMSKTACQSLYYAVEDVAKAHPDWFAPEPDPVEEFIGSACDWCKEKGACILRWNGKSIADCRDKRDALRAYVADLLERAEGK